MTTGLDSFSHLEDKIYRIIEQHKTIKQQRDQIESQLTDMQAEITLLREDNERLTQQVDQLVSERNDIKGKVEGMLEAIAIIDPEIAEAMK